MVGSRNDWFPTSVWHFSLENYQQLNPPLLETIYAEERRDSQGEKWSNILGWHSKDRLHERDSFDNLIQIINQNVLEVATFLQWDLQKFSLKITTCWAIINRKLASNSVHNHPNSILSGVYYLKTPENCGGIFFSDPRPASQMIVPPSIELNLWTFPKITYKAREGTMLIFPSWLLHGVEMNMSDEDRVCISFNIGIVPINR
ncbi:TIGR02466 family protein [Dolichospermum lemmermannii CS-548]|uniref:TIGR02466 family protein n=1 Tax=Dolichospermum lemmermannii TaxID=54295 RepID=UPI00232C8136|nr:TIGR02466 family protein [Dolichospermum lemmermannii]MDB9435352.1 TIGR02466 family protein [Dolichospermum lemmermannii CS-548]